MASTFSPSLRIELIGDGDQSGIWGQTTNNNLGALIEQSITGVVNITMSNTNYTLTNFNGVTDEARNAVLIVSGTNTASRDIIAPLVEKLYTVVNNTTGGFAIRVIGSSGTGVTILNGNTALIYCDGTNFYQAVSSAATSLTTSNFTVQQVGTTLVFQYNGANVATLSSTGTFAAATNLTAAGQIISAGNVTAYGTI